MRSPLALKKKVKEFEVSPRSEPTGHCKGGRYQVTRKLKFSLRDAVAFQAPASNWNVKQKLIGCISVSLMGFQF